MGKLHFSKYSIMYLEQTLCSLPFISSGNNHSHIGSVCLPVLIPVLEADSVCQQIFFCRPTAKTHRVALNYENQVI